MSFFDDIIFTRTINLREQKEIDACGMCGRPLGPDTFFVIAKAFQSGKPVLESAQCYHCQSESQNYASEQSIENIMLYSGRRFNEYMRDPIQRKLYHLEDPSCLITGEGLERADSFELYHFNIPGYSLEENNFVFVGPTALEQMGELLSEETRDSWGKYTEQLVPENPDMIISPSPMFFG